MSKLARLALLLVTLWGCYGAAALPVPAPARGLRPGGRARRHRRLRRLDHADRADVPHGGQPARRGADVGARRAAGRRAAAIATRRWPPRSCCWWCGPAASAGSPTRRTGASWPAWAAAAAAAAWLGWRPGLHLAAISLVDLAGAARLLRARPARALDRRRWSASLAAVGAAAAGPAIDRRIPASAALFTYGLIVAFAGLYHPAVHRPARPVYGTQRRGLDPAARAARHPDARPAARRHAVGAAQPTTAPRCGSPTPASRSRSSRSTSRPSARCSTPRCSS